MPIVAMPQVHVLKLLRLIIITRLPFTTVTRSSCSKNLMKVIQHHADLANFASLASTALCCSDEPQLGKSRGKKRSKLTRTRKTRGMLADQQKGPKSFAAMLEEVSSVWKPRICPSKHKLDLLACRLTLISFRQRCQHTLQQRSDLPR